MLLRSAERPRSMAASSPRGVTPFNSFDQRVASWTRPQQGCAGRSHGTRRAARKHVSVTEAASLEVPIVLFITSDLLGQGESITKSSGKVGLAGFDALPCFLSFRMCSD